VVVIEEVCVRNLLYGTGFLVILLSLAATVSAGTPPAVVPEINGGSLTMGLGLVSGGLLILRARWGAKRR
jgi:hypothetical protein